MKKAKINPDTCLIPAPHKITENLFKKKPNK